MEIVSTFTGSFQANGNGAWQEIGTTAPMEIPANGYLAVYLSNQSRSSGCHVCGNVFFDRVKVRFSQGKLKEETHYYPFGLPMGNAGSTASNFLPNRRKYQSNEYIKDLSLNWMDFNFRQYDPQLGRFLSVDPLAASGGQDRLSPYVAMGNQPEFAVDPNGLIPGLAFQTAGGAGMGGFGDGRFAEGSLGNRAPWDNGSGTLGSFGGGGSKLVKSALWRRVMSNFNSMANGSGATYTRSGNGSFICNYYDDWRVAHSYGQGSAGLGSASELIWATHATLDHTDAYGMQFYQSFIGGFPHNPFTKVVANRSSTLWLNDQEESEEKPQLDKGFGIWTGLSYGGLVISTIGGITEVYGWETFGKAAGKVGVIIGTVTVINDGVQVYKGKMSGGRFSYHLTGFGTSVLVGAQLGGPYGAAVGVGFATGELGYDYAVKPYVVEPARQEFNRRFNL